MAVSELLENTNRLKGKLKENVENYREQALISKKLATIITDVPISFDEDSFLPKPYDKETLNSLFVELEFQNFRKKNIRRRLYCKYDQSQTSYPSRYAIR